MRTVMQPFGFSLRSSSAALTVSKSHLAQVILPLMVTSLPLSPPASAVAKRHRATTSTSSRAPYFLILIPPSGPRAGVTRRLRRADRPDLSPGEYSRGRAHPQRPSRDDFFPRELRAASIDRGHGRPTI